MTSIQPNTDPTGRPAGPNSDSGSSQPPTTYVTGIADGNDLATPMRLRDY